MADEILKTTDYSIFKRLEGNRPVTMQRVLLIEDSIRAIGWISNPIIVNENMEVIDGQGRLEALKRIGAPVEYRIIRGANINHCRVMNDVNRQWQKNEYIQSYAETGSQSYKRLWQIMTMYEIDARTALRLMNKDDKAAVLKSGELDISNDAFGKGLKRAPFYSAYWKTMKRFAGNGNIKKKVIFFLIEHGGYPHQRIIDALKVCDPQEIYCTGDERLIECIENVVNKNQRKDNRLRLVMDYRSKG